MESSEYVPAAAAPATRAPVSIEERLGPGNYRTIARKTGLTPQHVARVIKGTKGASFHVAVAIAAAADVTIDQLKAYIYAHPERLVIRGRRTHGDPAIRHALTGLVRQVTSKRAKAKAKAA